jgi:biotin operon repressor
MNNTQMALMDLCLIPRPRLPQSDPPPFDPDDTDTKPAVLSDRTLLQLQRTYELLVRYGPLTAIELAAYLRCSHKTVFRYIAELRARGRVVGKRTSDHYSYHAVPEYAG